MKILQDTRKTNEFDSRDERRCGASSGGIPETAFWCLQITREQIAAENYTFLVDWQRT